jgi:hypothetical protein
MLGEKLQSSPPAKPSTQTIRKFFMDSSSLGMLRWHQELLGAIGELLIYESPRHA